MEFSADQTEKKSAPALQSGTDEDDYASNSFLDDTASPSGKSYRQKILEGASKNSSRKLFEGEGVTEEKSAEAEGKKTESKTAPAESLEIDDVKVQSYLLNRDALRDFIRSEGNVFATLSSRDARADQNSSQPYVGLANQGATCYLNSLLQSLFMIKEFRQRVFAFCYDPDVHGDPDMCIPLQVQKLFARLSHSRRPYLSTKPLTKSFGWNSAQAFQQQDAQELFQVLLDALERSTPGATFARPVLGKDIRLHSRGGIRTTPP